MYEKYSKYQDLAKKQARKSKEQFSFDNMKQLIKDYFDKIPKSVTPQLQLPKLKKIELPSLKKIN